MTTARKQTSYASIRLSVGQIQLLSRIVDSSTTDSPMEKGESEYETRRRAMLADVLRKLDDAIERISRRVETLSRERSI